MIEIKHLSKTFVVDSKEYTALSDINLRIDDGDIFGVIGVSGAGKSTLVRCINLLERPTTGSILIDGIDVTHVTGKRLLELRASIGMIFQDFSLFSQRTVLENVMFPLELRKDTREHRIKRAKELLQLVGLEEKEANYPSQLSGGQQQRVAIARSLANHPSILLCDEATSALDTRTTNSVLKLLREINKTLGVTIVVITHEMSVIDKICNKVAVLDGARIIEQGSTAEIFSAPTSPITKELLGQVTWDA